MAASVKNLSCIINFNNNGNAVFFTGQTVTGTATLTVLKSMSVRHVSIIIKGKAKTHWETGSGKSKRHHRGKEVLLNSISVLMGSNNGSEIELPAGVYNFNFSCFLPPQLPSTLENNIGKIRYTVKVLVDRPLKFDDKFVVIFTVLRPLDLNSEPVGVRHPCEINESKTFCCWCCAYRGFNIISRIPQTGYVPGQTITVDAEIVNTSSIKLNRVNVILLKTYKFRSDHKTSTQQFHNVTKIRIDEIMNRMSFRKHLSIPPLLPSLTSKLIDIVYSVVVIGKVSGCHLNPRASIPITIGTNGLLGSYQQEPLPMPMPIPMTSYNNQEEEKSSFQKQDLPPTYEDTMTKS